MKLEELVGKVVIRNKVIKEESTGLFGYGGATKDASYTHHPIKIEAIEHGVVYFKDDPLKNVLILSAKYHDDNWAPISERYIDLFWVEPPAPGTFRTAKGQELNMAVD